MKIWRQGDVLIMEAKELPKDATPLPKTSIGIILAAGEATGHHHRIAVLDREAELFESQTVEDRFLRIMAASGVEVVHEEHAPILLPPGDYRVRLQREWSDAEEPIRVLD